MFDMVAASYAAARLNAKSLGAAKLAKGVLRSDASDELKAAAQARDE